MKSKTTTTSKLCPQCSSVYAEIMGGFQCGHCGMVESRMGLDRREKTGKIETIYRYKNGDDNE